MGRSNLLTRRGFLKVAGLAVAGTALAACTAPTAPQTTSDEAAPAESTAEIRITHWWGDALNDAIQLFADTHPEIGVVNEPAPWDGYADRLPTTIAAGTAQDVFFLDSGYFGVMLPQGIAADLTSFLEADSEIDPEKWAIDPALDTGVDGIPYGLPQWHPDSANIVANKDLFAEVGLEVPEYGTEQFMKWDWATFLEAAMALTKRDDDGRIIQWGVGGVGRGVWSPHRDMVWSNGGEFFDDITHNNPTIARFTDPEFVEAWQWLVDLDLTHQVATRPDDEAAFGTQGAYLSGKVAMTWMWNLYGVMKEANFEWGVMTPPFQARRANKYGGNSWCISSSSEAKDAAYTYISWATTRLEGQVAFTKAGTLPVYDPVRILPEAENEQQSNLWNLIIARQAAAVEDDAARPFSLGPNGAEITNILEAENDLIYNGDKTVEEGLASAKEKVDALLAA